MDPGPLCKMVLAEIEPKSSSLIDYVLFLILMPVTSGRGRDDKASPSICTNQRWPCSALASEKAKGVTLLNSSGLRRVCNLPKIYFSTLSRVAFKEQYFYIQHDSSQRRTLMPWIYSDLQASCHGTNILLSTVYVGGGGETRFFQVN